MGTSSDAFSFFRPILKVKPASAPSCQSTALPFFELKRSLRKLPFSSMLKWTASVRRTPIPTPKRPTGNTLLPS
ncbi:MAG TPA: hypothetical protein IAB87_03695, partial [Candidatus Coprenecus merdipullorum]|nr:hypothetical protein [Candidatus Coprenecus merdipullorum]